MNTTRLAQYVHDFDASEGNEVTSAKAVASSRSKFLDMTGDAGGARDSLQNVVILQVRGTFPVVLDQPEIVDGSAVNPTTQRTAIAITTVYTADLTQTLDVATQYPDNTLIDLGALGSPVIDIPIR